MRGSQECLALRCLDTNNIGLHLSKPWLPALASFKGMIRIYIYIHIPIIPLKEARRSQEEPGGARRSQKEPGGARRTQEDPGGPRRSQEEPRGARMSQGEP